MMAAHDQQVMEEVKARLKPPTETEYNEVTARWLFGKNAEKMLKYAPFSFVLMKLMWRKGEEPWAK
jgi:hypothetical protein